MLRRDVQAVIVSPDRRLHVAFQIIEWTSGLISHAPRIIDRDSGTILIDLWDSDWDAELCWLGNGCVRLDLQRIDRNEWCALVLDPQTQTYVLIDEGMDKTGRPRHRSGI